MAASGLVPEPTSVTVVRKLRASSATACATPSMSSVSVSGASRDGSAALLVGVTSAMVVAPLRADPSSALERPPERDLVGVLQVPADRQARGEPADGESHGDQHAREVRGCRLALDVRVHREDDLGDGSVREATATYLARMLVPMGLTVS